MCGAQSEVITGRLEVKILSSDGCGGGGGEGERRRIRLEMCDFVENIPKKKKKPAQLS